VVVLGSVNIDLVVRVPRLPAAGETVTGGTFAQHHGGKGANQAVAAARLGAEVAFVGAVGDDDFGRAARQALVEDGVNVDGLTTLMGSPTGAALIVVNDQGENQIAVASGANAEVDADAWPHDAGFGDVFVAGFEVDDDAIVSRAVDGSKVGEQIVINPAPAREIPTELLATRPILVPNEIEALALTGEADPEAAAKVLAQRSNAPVVVTLGPRGAIVVADGRVDAIAAPHVDAVDTTGAGDAFVGALAAELAIGRPLLEAARFAVYAASLSVRVAGAREGMPTRGEVEKLMQRESS
jgi:ribokinase